MRPESTAKTPAKRVLVFGQALENRSVYGAPHPRLSCIWFSLRSLDPLKQAVFTLSSGLQIKKLSVPPVFAMCPLQLRQEAFGHEPLRLCRRYRRKCAVVEAMLTQEMPWLLQPVW